MSRGPVVRLSDLPPELRELAKQGKKAAIEAERGAFRRYCLAAGLPAPESELRFHPTRKFAFDFAWSDHWLALEVEGGIYGQGRPCAACGQRPVRGHNSGTGITRDMEKYSIAATMGWRILRVTPKQLHTPVTLELVRRALSVAQLATDT